MRRANQDLEQFAYSVSHDLQEPLRSVAAYSQLLQRQYRDRLDEKAGEFLHHIIGGAQRLSSLISDLLAYSRAGSRDASNVELTDTVGVVSSVVKSLRHVIEENRAAITWDELPAVYVRKAHLEQLLQNLISNALKYRKETEAPKVHIAAERDAAAWRFSVADNGIGIAPEHHGRVFGVFKRLHSSEKYAGTGIGLAICQRVVERYGGRIWVESQAGVGSTFFFTIPYNSTEGLGHATPSV